MQPLLGVSLHLLLLRLADPDRWLEHWFDLGDCSDLEEAGPYNLFDLWFEG